MGVLVSWTVWSGMDMLSCSNGRDLSSKLEMASAWRTLEHSKYNGQARQQLKALGPCAGAGKAPCHGSKGSYHKDIKVVPKGAAIDCVLQPFRKLSHTYIQQL